MKHIHKNVRAVFLIVLIIIVVALHKILTNSWTPTSSNTTLIFQNLILMIVLGLTIIEPKFTKPTDAIVNSIMVIITLLSVRDPSQFIAWSSNLLYAGIVSISSLACIILGSEEESQQTGKNRIAYFLYKLSTSLGQSKIIFSITFILSVFSFYTSQQRDFLILLLFWAFIVVAQPIGLLPFLQNLYFSATRKNLTEDGKIISCILPGFLRYEPYKDSQGKIGDFIILKQSQIKLFAITDSYCLNEKTVTQAVVIFTIPETDLNEIILDDNKIYHVGSLDKLKKVIKNDNTIKDLHRFVGVIIENSRIGEITFKVTSDTPIEEGNILEANTNGQQILFQIVDAKTDTEVLLPDLKTGIVKGIAQQVGMWNSERIRFDKYGWVPPMHTPLFIVDEKYDVKYKINPNEFILGYIPGTKFPIIANVDTLITHHTAILGVTGSGKTEMAFTLIDKMITLKTKVFCVDFTGDYLSEFSGLSPQKLSIPPTLTADLNSKLLAIETEGFGAPNATKALEEFKLKLLPVVKKMVQDFIESDKYLGIFELSEIANTSATIAITELYLSQIFAYARGHRDTGQKFCIVLEEAHTVIPESMSMGVKDKYSQSTISKISQIALQGRKYNVGLLVIAQRTANVTKTVLNQCNSIIVFNSYDKTGFEFLENYVGSGMISAIQNLKWLQAMVVGRGFKSGRPLIMGIPPKPKFTELGKDANIEKCKKI